MQVPPFYEVELSCDSCGQYDTVYLACGGQTGCYTCGIYPDLEGALDTTELATNSAAVDQVPEQNGSPTGASAVSHRLRPERYTGRRSQLNYAAINRAALARWPEVLARLLPGGKPEDNEWLVGSLCGEVGRSLKVRLRGDRVGAWCDFATGEKGGDPISLAAAVAGVSQSEAARRLARMLGLEGAHHG